ncbi:MAG: DUF4367 domain-containing protein [Oscillospiraceae bacterium]|nr:DUF4367 domain-containing protein [Oscillospiraceae bacterium]
MSGLDSGNRKDYSKYDEMSTESLEELLRLDAELPDGEESDIDEILYISEVIAKREREHPTGRYSEVDVDTAWETFQTKYLPYLKDGRSLYDFDDDEPGHTEATVSVSDTSSTDGKKHIPARTKRHLGRVAAIAAAVAVLLSLMTVTAYALGYDLWGAFARWTQDIFSFVSASETGDTDSEKEPPIMDVEYATLQEALDIHGVTEPLAPTWVPDGFAIDSVKVDDTSSPRVVIFQANYCCEERWIAVQITMHRDSHSSTYTEWQKDDEGVTTIELENCTFYMMRNGERECAAWSNGAFEGYITADVTFEELSEIVKSIYVRNE